MNYITHPTFKHAIHSRHSNNLVRSWIVNLLQKPVARETASTMHPLSTLLSENRGIRRALLSPTRIPAPKKSRHGAQDINTHALILENAQHIFERPVPGTRRARAHLRTKPHYGLSHFFNGRMTTQAS